MTDQLQIMREIDKFDKIGAAGVREMLTTGRVDASGAFNAGLGLDTFQADFICAAILSGKTNLDAVRHIETLTSRINMIAVLDSGDGVTAWDRLLEMPTCAEQTWKDGKRPENIAWAVDDIVAVIKSAARNMEEAS